MRFKVDYSLSLQQIKAALATIDYPQPITGVQEGWLSVGEEKALYGLALLLAGPFLEIGSWAGKSTTCIAKGIVHSGNAVKKFVSCELDPTPDNFPPIGPGMRGFFVDGELLCEVPQEDYEKDVKAIVEKPGGIIGLLHENLRREGVIDLVQLQPGDFRHFETDDVFQLIFSDCMHTAKEIAFGAPAMHRLIGDRTVILAAHDTYPETEMVLRRFFDIGDSFYVETLFVCEASTPTRKTFGYPVTPKPATASSK